MPNSKKLKKLREIDMESLPEVNHLNVFTLSNSIERGLRCAIKPWQLDMPKETSDNQLQGVYNVMIQEYINSIMEVVINEIFIP